jgi:hypothetical protein
MNDPEMQWALIRALWDELDIEHILAGLMPLGRRWQLDLLVRRVRHMDQIFDEAAFAGARFLPVVIDD